MSLDMMDVQAFIDSVDVDHVDIQTSGTSGKIK